MIKNPVDTALEKHLDYLKLPYCKENCQPFAAEANAIFLGLCGLGTMPGTGLCRVV